MPKRSDSEYEEERRKKKSKKQDKKARKDSSDDSRRKKKYRRSRSRSGDRKKDRYKRRSPSWNDNSRYRDKGRDRDWGRKWGDRDYNRRGGDRDRDREQAQPFNKHKHQKRRFMYDSPPSQGGNTSDDPQKMQKLRQLKAQQELISSKADRKLYLGNLPPHITAPQLMELLNAALKKMEINCQTEGDSIISAWINPDGVGHYAFIEFRTAQEATNGTALNNATLFDYQLKVGRPKQYLQYNRQLMEDVGNLSTMEGILKKIENIGLKENVEQIKVQERIICPPSRVLVLRHIVGMEQLSIDQQYQQILEDVKDMGTRFGKVLSITIPRPNQTISLQHAPTRVKGLGLVFIQYQNLEMAKYARKKFVTKMFSERSVACGFFDQQRYREGDLDIDQKVHIPY